MIEPRQCLRHEPAGLRDRQPWKAAAEREEYTKFMDERNDEGAGESAMALAFRRAMESKKKG